MYTCSQSLAFAFTSFLTNLGASVGEKLVLSDMVYEPPRAGPTVWSIGVADRSATGYIPDPDPKYVNKLFVNHPEKLVDFSS